MLNRDKLILIDFCGTIVDLSTGEDFINYLIKDNKIRKLILYFSKKVQNLIFRMITDAHFLHHKNFYSIAVVGMKKKTVEKKAFEYYEIISRNNIRNKVVLKVNSLIDDGYSILISAGYYEYIRFFKSQIEFHTISASKLIYILGLSTGLTINNNFRYKKILSLRKILGLNFKNYYSDILVVTDSLDDLELMKIATKIIFVGDKEKLSQICKYLKTPIEWISYE